MNSLESVIDSLDGVRKQGSGYIALCPAHEDHHRSLSVSAGDGGRVLLKCHAGCEFGEIVSALKLKASDLFPDNGNGSNNRKIVAVYDYVTTDGKLYHQTVRYDNKSFTQRRPDGAGGWIWNLKDITPVLYNLPQVTKAIQEGRIILVLEGEKDCDNAKSRLGAVATTNPMGAGKWRGYYSDSLTGAKVVIIGDNDEAGRRHAQSVAASLYGKAAGVKIVELPGIPEKGDLSDWLDAGGTREQLKSLITQALPWEPTEEATPAEARASIGQPKWPQLAPAALQGLAGDIVKAIEPHSEADPVALLINILTSFGNCIGASPHFKAEADRHSLRLFACLVGRTSKGRKGTSWNHIKRLFEIADPGWIKRILSGLSSGEGLIWNVRDPIKKVVDGESKTIDEGINDKRLLAMESEFASVIKQTNREGNTLSATIRQAWDDGTLRTLTKNSPAIATGAHISIIGHITQEELLRHLNSTEAANGFANRFLWICVKRSKALPEGGKIYEVDFAPLIGRLKESILFARETSEVLRDEDARAIWFAVYEKLSDGLPGLLGAVTSRAEAQVMRIACIYALLDCSNLVRAEHLTAALALWDYAFASAEYIFGEKLGDPIADTIKKAVYSTPRGLTRTDISNLFGRNRKSGDIEGALISLSERGLIKSVSEKSEGGRSAERWMRC